MKENLETLIAMYESEIKKLDPETDKEKYNLYIQEIAKLKVQIEENNIIEMIALYRDALSHLNPMEEEKVNFYMNEIQRLETILEDNDIMTPGGR